MEQIPKDFYLHFRVDLPVARHLYGHPAKLNSKFTGHTSVSSLQPSRLIAPVLLKLVHARHAGECHGSISKSSFCLNLLCDPLVQRSKHSKTGISVCRVMLTLSVFTM